MLRYITLWFIIDYNTYFRLMPFSDINISQGSVATCLRRGGIFKHSLLQIYYRVRLWKKFEKRLLFDEVMGKSLVSWFFDSQCISLKQ